MDAAYLTKNGIPASFWFRLVVLGVLVGSATPRKAAAASFVNARPLIIPRKNHAATLLPNGKLLVAGGSTTGGVVTNSADVCPPFRIDGDFGGRGHR